MDVDPKLTAPLATGATPPGFRAHALELAWTFGVPREVVWGWLNDPQDIHARPAAPLQG